MFALLSFSAALIAGDCILGLGSSSLSREAPRSMGHLSLLTPPPDPGAIPRRQKLLGSQASLIQPNPFWAARPGLRLHSCCFTLFLSCGKAARARVGTRVLLFPASPRLSVLPPWSQRREVSRVS